MQPTYLLTILALSTTAFATCCPKYKCHKSYPIGGRPECVSWECADGTLVGGFNCCGYLKCNIVCCNCDATSSGDVCRGYRSVLLTDVEAQAVMSGESDFSGMTDEETFRAMNTDGSGKMTLTQLAAAMGASEHDFDIVSRFTLFDKNHDGFLTVDEMRL